MKNDDDDDDDDDDDNDDNDNDDVLIWPLTFPHLTGKQRQILRQYTE